MGHSGIYIHIGNSRNAMRKSFVIFLLPVLMCSCDKGIVIDHWSAMISPICEATYIHNTFGYDLKVEAYYTPLCSYDKVLWNDSCTLVLADSTVLVQDFVCLTAW